MYFALMISTFFLILLIAMLYQLAFLHEERLRYTVFLPIFMASSLTFSLDHLLVHLDFPMAKSYHEDKAISRMCELEAKRVKNSCMEIYKE